MDRNESEPRSRIETVIATPVSDVALTEDDLLESFNQEDSSTRTSTSMNRNGSISPRGQMTLTLGDDISIKMTASQQYDLLQVSKRVRHLVLIDLFIGFIFIPLFKLPAWVFLYMLVPIIGFIGSRGYSKKALKIHLILTWGTTAVLGALPFVDFDSEISTGGALAFWALFMLIKTALCFLSVYFVFILRNVSDADCRALCELHSRGVINLR